MGAGGVGETAYLIRVLEQGCLLACSPVVHFQHSTYCSCPLRAALLTPPSCHTPFLSLSHSLSLSSLFPHCAQPTPQVLIILLALALRAKFFARINCKHTHGHTHTRTRTHMLRHTLMCGHVCCGAPLDLCHK